MFYPTSKTGLKGAEKKILKTHVELGRAYDPTSQSGKPCNSCVIEWRTKKTVPQEWKDQLKTKRCFVPA